MQRSVLILAFALSFSVVLGCAPDSGGRVGVSGTVTLGGQPLPNGTIQFVAADGSQMGGATITNGKYDVPAAKGLKPGTYTVRVSSVEEAASSEEAPGDSTAVEAKNKDLIPEEFNAKSTVTAEIKDTPTNTFDLTIP